MPTLRGTMGIWSEDPAEPCRWCGEPTFSRLAPLGDSRLVPLHAVCGAEVIVLYRDLEAGRLIPDEVTARLRRLQSG
jgi:hypothetical protein